MSRRNTYKLGAQAAHEALHEKLFEAARQRRLHNPLAGERAVMRVLKALDLKFEREHRLGSSLYTVGFYCPSIRLAFEIEGDMSRDFKRPDWSKRKASLCRALGIGLRQIRAGQDSNDLILLEQIREAAGVVRAKELADQARAA